MSEALQKAVESLRRDLTLANEKVRALEETQNVVSPKYGGIYFVGSILIAKKCH